MVATLPAVLQRVPPRDAIRQASYQARTGRDGRSAAVAEIVVNGNAVALGKEQPAERAADVSCAAGNEDVQAALLNARAARGCCMCPPRVAASGLDHLRLELVCTVSATKVSVY